MSSSDEDLIMIDMLLDKKRKRKFWVHPLLERRRQQGEFHQLIQELKLYHDRFRQYFRMSVAEFEALLAVLGPHLRRQHTNYREPIDPEQRLAVCLRFLSTGDSFTTIASSFRLGKSTVAEITKEVCGLIWSQLVDEYMPEPTEATWRKVAAGFQKYRHFPNCIGALDGKHVVIQKPAGSGSLFFNYKGTFSIVLLALVDHNYNFIAVDVGAYGSNSDGGIFANSNLGKSLDAGTLHVPPPAPLPDAPELGSLPYTVVADDAFPLKTYVMKPYPGRHLSEERLIFNFRLSSARRMVENAFGILTQRWRVYQRRMQLAPDTVDKVIKATCVLCNYLRKETAEDGRHRNVEADGDENEDEEAVDRFLPNIPPLRGHRRPLQAMQNRDTLCRYFTSPAGQVNWQLDRVRRGIL
ncbi:hypothetical protein ACEWY4_003869 [Coilia grayii]|uniref:DDE Tnp4 domain-containing protein n=1 Tax=Coilia grayii TaxID=363190 RepID=A0ABD1KJW2_9TELE